MAVTPIQAPPTEAVLVVNAQSRQGVGTFKLASRGLTRLGIRLRGTHLVDEPARMPAIIANAVDAGVPLVVVGGGDGTISAAANQLAGRETILGVIPLGTGNDFARNVGLPFDVGRACEVIASGKVASVDLGQLDRGCFVNVASVGFSGLVAGSVTVQSKRMLGPSVFLLAALRELLALKPFRASIRADVQSLNLVTSLVVIGNGRYHAGGRLIGPRASIDDHHLTVYATPDGSRRSLLRLAWRLAHAQPIGRGDFPYFTTTRVEIETDPPVVVDADGEIVQSTPVAARVLPNALRVMVPALFDDR